MKRALSILLVAALVVCFAFALVACNPQEKQEIYTPDNAEINALKNTCAREISVKTVSTYKVADGNGNFIVTNKEISKTFADNNPNKSIILWDQTVTQADGSKIRELRVAEDGAYCLAKFENGSDKAFFSHRYSSGTVNNQDGTNNYLPDNKGSVENVSAVITASNYNELLMTVTNLNYVDSMTGIKFVKGNDVIRKEITIELNINEIGCTAVLYVENDKIKKITADYDNGDQYIVEYTYDIAAFEVPSASEWRELYPVAE